MTDPVSMPDYNQNRMYVTRVFQREWVLHLYHPRENIDDENEEIILENWIKAIYVLILFDIAIVGFL